MGFTNPLSAAALAAALAATTLTVTGQVTTNPTTGTDEDIVRIYTQAQIDSLSATDKNSNFVIYNTTSGAINYCVNGNIVIPPTAKVPVFGLYSFPALSIQGSGGQAVTISATLATGYARAIATLASSNLSTSGETFIAGSDPANSSTTGLYTTGGSPVPGTKPLSGTTVNLIVTDSSGNPQTLVISNVSYNPTSGAFSFSGISGSGSAWSTGTTNPLRMAYSLD